MSDTSPGAEAFQKRVLDHLAGAYLVAMCYLGDRLGLFRSLAEHGPATSEALAQRLGLRERYVREWLYALASAAYLTYDADTEAFALPAEHRAILAEADDVRFLGGWFQLLAAQTQVTGHVADAFRSGGGVLPSLYSPDLWEGEARTSAASYATTLVADWRRLLPGVVERLERGADVADIGCGAGFALQALATAFPRIRCVGYDPAPPAVEQATLRVRAAGLADRVTFAVWNPATPLPGRYDLITTFMVVHDAARPQSLLTTIRAAVRSGGLYVCRDLFGPPRFDPTLGLRGVLCYSESVLYCLTTALAAGGDGLGSLGLTAERFLAMCQEAGFGDVRQIELDDPLAGLFLAHSAHVPPPTDAG
ncbi:MAG TPA: class I SAM-dependent methyltransferase [Ktedonobacterales bacterium]|nr:class I SAM-dependent methyltransferase [Ktedonobacterales bacterium]